MEFPILLIFFAYIYYLRHVADQRTESKKEEERLSRSIEIYKSGDVPKAFEIFDKRIVANQKSSVSYLYRGLCFKELGNNNNNKALNDFQTGNNYDNTNPDLFTELRKLQRENGQLQDALHSFSTAIRISCGPARTGIFFLIRRNRTHFYIQFSRYISETGD